MPGQIRPDVQAGTARITGATGAIAAGPTGLIQSCLRTGAGVYEITTAGCNSNEHIVICTPYATSAIDVGIAVDPVSNTLIRIRTVQVTTAVAAADVDFVIDIDRFRTAN